jgi:hypothetical protein
MIAILLPEIYEEISFSKWDRARIIVDPGAVQSKYPA